MRRRSLRRACVLLAALSLITLAGCTAEGLLRLASSADVINTAVTVQHDIAYGTLPRQRFDLYLPRHLTGQPLPLVVFVHGGSWYWGAKEEYRFVGAALAERGAAVAVINYRLYPQAHLPDSLADVATAVAQAERAAKPVTGDHARVYLMGHSAGAQLAALVAFDPAHLAAAGASPVSGFVGLAGPYDFLPLTDDYLKEYFGPAEKYPLSQPVNVVSHASVPSLLVQGLKDTTVWPRNTASLGSKLQAAGVPVDTLLLDEDDHSTILKRLARPYRHADPMVERVLRFVGAAQ